MPERPALTGGPIFVTLDGSELAERSLPYVTLLASALKRPIVLFMATHSAEVWNHVPSGDYETTASAYCSSHLDAIRKRAGLEAAEPLVRPGFGRDVILPAADEVRASMIVMSSHGRSGLTRWTYGSTTADVAHSAHVPVLVIGREVLSGKAEQPAIKHIVVPLDGSEHAEAALPAAVQLADALSARVTLVRVVPWAVEAYPFIIGSMQPTDLDAQLESAGASYLEQRSADVKAAGTALLRGPAASSLVDFIEQRGVDLVVMTTHARAGIARAVLGSTADRMLQSHAPVLLIRPNSN